MTLAKEVIPPSSDKNIVEVVLEWIDKHFPNTKLFEHYDEALKATWPSIFKDDPGAAIFLSIEVYLEIAEARGFKVEPAYLRRAQREGNIL